MSQCKQSGGIIARKLTIMVAFMLAIMMFVVESICLAVTPTVLHDSHTPSTFATAMNDAFEQLGTKRTNLKVTACQQTAPKKQSFEVKFNNKDKNFYCIIYSDDLNRVNTMEFIIRGRTEQRMKDIFNTVVSAMMVCGIHPDDAAKVIVAASKAGSSYIWNQSNDRNYVLMYKTTSKPGGETIGFFKLVAARN